MTVLTSAKIYFCLLLFMMINSILSVEFSYPYYYYKKKSFYERLFYERQEHCSHSTNCSAVSGIFRDRCVRKCISPACYQILYQWDELEEGEVDIRLSSFKGCLVQQENS